MPETTEIKDITLILTGTLPTISSNFEEYKAWYQDKLAEYKNIVTEESLPAAKKDLATLRAEIKRLARVRIDESAKLKQPITDMETKVKELEKDVAEVVEHIAAQVEKYEVREREWCRAEMVAVLKAQYEALGVRDEFQTGDVGPCVGMNKRTKTGLGASSKRLIELMAKDCRGQQDKIDGRLARLEADCSAAGVQPMGRSHIESFLMEDDALYARKLAGLIKLEVDRAKAAEEAQRARIAAEEKALAVAAANAELAKQKKEAEEKVAEEQKIQNALAKIKQEEAEAEAKMKRVADEAARLAKEEAEKFRPATAAEVAAVSPMAVPLMATDPIRAHHTVAESANTGMFGRPVPVAKPETTTVIVNLNFSITTKRPANRDAISQYFLSRVDAMKLDTDILQTLVLSVEPS